jgi:hypothetical protein
VHPANHLYGHGTILREAAGVHELRPIRGYVQHGWAVGSGLDAPYRLVRWLPNLVWSAENLEAARHAGLRHVEAVGAPFCYLADSDAVERGTNRPAPARGAIVYPHHGWRRAGVQGDHQAMIDAIAARESGDVTVCLYWREFEDEVVRRHYEHAGFRVISHGGAEDPRFLVRLRDELLNHRRAVTNRIGTAIWYAAYLGLNVEVYGPLFVVQETAAEADSFDRLQRARWPAIFTGELEGADARALGADQLGAEYVRSPTELRRLLGLERDRRYDRLLTVAVRTEHLLRASAARVLEHLRPPVAPYAGYSVNAVEPPAREG